MHYFVFLLVLPCLVFWGTDNALLTFVIIIHFSHNVVAYDVVVLIVSSLKLQF